MKLLRSIFCLIAGLCLCTVVSAQVGEVKTKTVYEVDSKGKKILDSKEECDDRGRTTKEYVYDEYGDLKKYFTYEYKGKKVVTEYEYSPSGKLKEKSVYQYNEAGKRISKLIYDETGKLLKKKVYEYQYYTE